VAVADDYREPGQLPQSLDDGTHPPQEMSKALGSGMAEVGVILLPIGID
jgi:hypothetical protein